MLLIPRVIRASFRKVVEPKETPAQEGVGVIVGVLVAGNPQHRAALDAGHAGGGAGGDRPERSRGEHGPRGDARRDGPLRRGVSRVSDINAPGQGWEDKTKRATLYMQVPRSKLHTVLHQRVAWCRRPGMCPRCHASLIGSNNIIDRGILGLWCRECDDG